MAKKPIIQMKKIGDLGIKFPVVEVPMPGLYTEIAQGTVQIRKETVSYRIGIATNFSAFYYFVEKPSPIEILGRKKQRVFVVPLIAGEEGQTDGAIFS